MMKKPEYMKQGARNGQDEAHKGKQESGLRERQQSAGKIASTAQADDSEASGRTNKGNQKAAEGNRDKNVSKGVLVGRTSKRPGPTIVVILAADGHTARLCAERNGLRPTDWSFLTGMDTLAASQMVNMVVWRTGNYHTRKNFLDIEALIEKLGIEYVEAPL